MMKFIFLPDTRNLSKKICNYKTDLLFIKKWLTFFFPWLDSFLEMTPIFNWALFSWRGVGGVGRGGLVLIFYGTFDKPRDISEDYSALLQSAEL